MANFTMTLYEMKDNPLTPIFNFNYDFYCDDLEVKKKFEEKFINHYWMCEIGCETPARWNQMLKARLNLIMPYYRQLYQTELATQNIDFLLNKDLTESTTRELSGVENDTGNKRLTNEENHDITSSFSANGETTSSSSANGETTSSSRANGETTSTSQSTGNHKTSQLNDGVSNASLEQAYLTGVSRDDLTNTDNQQSQSTSNNNQQSQSTSNNNQQSQSTSNNHQQSTGRGTQSQEETNRRENTQSETITFKSQGNIGVTSSAELLQKWRDVLINIDEMIIKDCRDLFMHLY